MVKKKRGQLSIRFGDERAWKLIGIFALFLSFYLFIAFTSYFFTWENDHDVVFRFSWDMFFSDIPVDNWLGRLGAFLSDALVYWGFGIGAYGLVYLLFRYGMVWVKGISSAHLTPVLMRTVVWMVAISVVSSFLMQTFAFPAGGVFGQEVSGYLQNLLGIIGTVVFLVFVLLAAFVWANNPRLDELSWRQVRYETRRAWEDLREGRYGARPAPTPPRTKPESARAVVSDTSALPAEPVGQLSPDAGVVSFDLSRQRTLFEEDGAGVAQDGGGDLEMEINVPQTPELVLPEQAEQYKPPVVQVQEDSPGVSAEPYDPTLELSHYEYPHLQLLNEYEQGNLEVDREELEANKNQIIQTLLHFKIEIEKIRATIGPTVTLYEIVPARGVRISKIKNLEDDIALNLSALGIRIIAPIPGKGTIGIEVPNKNRQTVGMREVLMSEKFKRAKMELPIALGKNIQNEVFVADLAKMPHLLIAGATGQGKSVGINVVINSLLYKKHPSQVKLILIDPKKVELFPYARLENHFLGFLPDQPEPIVTDTTKVVHTLNSLTIEMEARYDLLKKAEVRNIAEYNDKFIARRLSPLKGHRFMPYIVLIIDEFADLIMTAGKEVELPIGRLAQLARAVGIHLIIATQRPSVNIITGVIKANFPARIAFKVASKVDSRTILDTGGAEQLAGRGDMLLSVGGDVIRLQSAFIDTPEVERIIEFISNQQGFAEPYFLPEFHPDGEGGGEAKQFSLAELDDMFEDAARLVVETQHGSTSMIQRRMKLGYNRAGRIMDQLESLGIVGAADGSKPREVLYYGIQELENYLNELRSRR